MPTPAPIHRNDPRAEQLVLCVSPYSEDHAGLKRVLRASGWSIESAYRCHEAIEILDWRKQGILAVICEETLPDGTWRDVSAHLGEGCGSPPVIVASTSANAPLWADVLSYGGSDLIAKPFREWEVVWALDAARTRKNVPDGAHASHG